jgi:Xaa-Pro aminopeptidase
MRRVGLSMADSDAIRGQWERARAMMEPRGIDALLITEKYNYWLFTGHRSEQFDGRQRPMYRQAVEAGLGTGWAASLTGRSRGWRWSSCDA